MAWAWAVAALFTIPCAGATAGAMEGRAELPTSLVIRGDFQLATAEGGMDAVVDATPAASLDLSWRSASGRIHASQWTATRPGGAPPTSVAEERVSTGAATLTAIECGPRCRLLVYAQGAGLVEAHAHLDGRLERLLQPQRYWSDGATEGSPAFQREFPAGSTLLAPTSAYGDGGRVTGAGELVVFARDVLLTVSEGDGRVRQIDVRDEQDLPSSAPAIGVRAASRWLSLRLVDAMLRADLDDVNVYAPSADVSVAGIVALSDASGYVRHAGEAQTVRQADMRLNGSVEMALAVATAHAGSLVPPEGRQTASFTGVASEFWLNGRLVDVPASAESPSATPKLALILAAVLVAIRLVLPLYSRIGRDKLLANEKRQAIVRAVEGASGKTIAQIARATNMARVVVRHHLAKLEAGGFIAARRHGRGTSYFLAGHLPSAEELVLLELLQEARRDQIARLLVQHQQMTQAAIADALGCSRRLVSYHIRLLEHAGLVQGERGWRRAYHATPRLASLLERMP